MDKKSNSPARPSGAERDFALLGDCNYNNEMRKCEQEIAFLCQKYGAGAVRRALAKVTTGAPRKSAERYFQVWLAVEVFRLANPGISVKGACDSVASSFRRNVRIYRNFNRNFQLPSGDLRRIYYRARRMPLPLRRHIRSATAPPTFENTIESALCDLGV
jgi:hypothetical protein